MSHSPLPCSARSSSSDLTTFVTAVVAKALTPAAKVQDEIQDTLVKGIQAEAGELGEPLNAAIEKLPADLKQGLLQRLNAQ